jgi:hypothetical protein
MYAPAANANHLGSVYQPRTVSKADADRIDHPTTAVADLNGIIGDDTAHLDKRLAAKKALALRQNADAVA